MNRKPIHILIRDWIIVILASALVIIGVFALIGHVKKVKYERHTQELLNNNDPSVFQEEW